MSNHHLIFDVSNLVYRVSYANSELKTSDGRFSGHVYGCISSILAHLRNDFKDLDTVLVFCYDGKGAKAFRQAIFPTYKTNRMPRDVDPLPEAKEVLKTIPGIHIEQAEREGDDGLAFAVKKRAGKPCTIVSGDKDTWALLSNPGVRIFSPNLKRYVTPEDVKEEYHLEWGFEKVRLCKALWGDASDGIKTFERLMKKQVAPTINLPQVTDLDSFFKVIDAERPKGMTDNTFQKLQDQATREVAQKAYQVILPQLDFVPSSVSVKDKDLTALVKHLENYECISLIDEVKNTW